MIDQPESGPFRLSCPSCKGNFTGRLPARAAKGLCPLCKKDLVLLPDGKIQSKNEYASTPKTSLPREESPAIEEPTDLGRPIFAALLFLVPAVILAITSTIDLPDKTHGIFHRMGERAGKGLLEIKSKMGHGVDSKNEEVERPTRQNSKEF